MKLFDKAKANIDNGLRKCFNCDQEFKPDLRNVKRGWGMNCSKYCAAKMKTKMQNLSELEKKSLIRDWRLKTIGI